MIFSKFFRGKNAMKTQAGGLGLNLYVAQKICSASGGKIEFESKENIGTSFRLFLPTNKSLITDFLIRRQETPNELLKKEREFVNITIHELKAPLGITKWSLEMLLSERTGDLNKVQLDLIQRVYRGNERLLVLVRDLLNLAKLQEGKFSIEVKSINIFDIVDEIVNGFKPEAAKKKIMLNWTKLNAKALLVNGDSSRLAQVMAR
jgi:signal transduction histidine kinase